MRAAAIEGIVAEDQGTGTTTVRTDPNDCHPDDLGTATIPAEIDLIVRRDQDDPETGLDSAKTDTNDCQALGELGIRRMTMRVGLVDHLAPGDPGTGIREMTMRVGLVDHLEPKDPGTQMSIEVIELGGPGDQVNRPPPLQSLGSVFTESIPVSGSS